MSGLAGACQLPTSHNDGQWVNTDGTVYTDGENLPDGESARLTPLDSSTHYC